MDYNTYVKFQVEDLRNYKKWRPLSLKYIKDNAKALVIPKAFEEFHYIFMSFTNWFIQQTNQCLTPDRDELVKLKLKLKDEKMKVLAAFFFKFQDQTISLFENSFFPKLNMGERLVVIKEKCNHKRAEKMLKMIKRHIDITNDFEDKVFKLYE